MNEWKIDIWPRRGQHTDGDVWDFDAVEVLSIAAAIRGEAPGRIESRNGWPTRDIAQEHAEAQIEELLRGRTARKTYTYTPKEPAND